MSIAIAAMSRELAEHAGRVVVEGAAAQAMVDIDAADDDAALAQRHREHRAQAQRGDRRGGVEALVAAGVDRDDGLAGLRGALRNESADRRGIGRARHRIDGREVSRHDRHQLVALAQQQEAALGGRQLDRGVDDLVEDARDIDRAS